MAGILLNIHDYLLLNTVNPRYPTLIRSENGSDSEKKRTAGPYLALFETAKIKIRCQSIPKPPTKFPTDHFAFGT
jgi:hypothetical protein